MLDFVDKLPQDPNEPTESAEATESQDQPNEQATQTGGDRGTPTKTGAMDAPRGKQTTAFKRRR